MSKIGYLKKVVKSGTLNWQSYEKKIAKQRRGTHQGGSGKPDYVRGNTMGEVKWRRTLSTYDVMAEARKGRNEIYSLNGFTENAIKHAKTNLPGVRLIDNGAIVKSRKRGY